MTRFSALLDACVLVPIALADSLLRLAEAGLYRPLWSGPILDEMVAAVEEIHPDLADGRARRRSDVMREAFEDACVTGWNPLLTGIDLPDKDDRHVVAAAQRGRADIIVTFNLKDFPSTVLNQLDIEIQHPDEFLLNQLDLAPDRTMLVLQQQSSAARNPAITIQALLDQLTRCGVGRFAEAAKRQLWRVQ